MRTEAVVARASRRRALHGLLALLLLLATTGSALHPYGLEAHHGGHPCAVCIASANAGAAPLPASLALPPFDRLPPARDVDRAPWVSLASTAYRARAPPV